MVALKQFSAEGVAVSNEFVKCSEQVTINGNTYYKGYLSYVPNQNIFGNDSVNYGVWDAATKGGNRKYVLIAGYPASAAQVSIDCKNGWIFSTVADDFWIYYLAHDPIRHSLCDRIIHIPYLLKTGTAATLATIKYPYFAKIGYVVFDVQGGLPGADATITLNTVTDSRNVIFSHSSAANIVELTSELKINPGETLTISTANGYEAYDFSIALLDT